MSIIALVILASGPFSARGAAGIGCERFATQQQAQRSYDKYPKASNLDPDGNGVACDELPDQTEIISEPYNTMFLMETFGGSKGNRVQFQDAPLAVLYGIKGFSGSMPTKRDVAGATCPSLVSSDPLDGVVPRGSNLFLGYFDGEDNERTPDVLEGALLFAWDGNGKPVNVNLYLVQHGLSRWDESTTPAFAADDFERADAQAKKNHAGMWGDCSDERTPMMAAFSPQNGIQAGTSPRTVVAEHGDWGDRRTFAIEEPGYYTVTVEANTANSFIEIRQFKNLTTGAEYPVFYWTVFGPQTYQQQVWLDAGDFVMDCRGVAGWSFRIETVPVAR